jgi:hypothetical protein
MSATERSLLRDQELVKMLLDEPELLAVADAFVETSGAGTSGARSNAVRSFRGPQTQRPHRTHIVSAAAALAALAAALALLLASPWQGSPSLAERALAAVGNGPVLHVVVSEPAFYGGPLVELSSGRTVAQTQQTEVWFDRKRQMKKTVYTLDGKVLDEDLETAQGGWTRTGPIFTCAWIAAHPRAATQMRVSCNASGANGTTPRTIPEDPPTLDPALAGFVDHDRSALASGAAREIGTGQRDGREVVWLEFDTNGGAEQVAVDAHSYEPLAIEEQGGSLTLRVLKAEALPYSANFFDKPRTVKPQLGSSVSLESDVTPQEAVAILGGRALWLGRSWNGLELVATTRQERTIGYGPAQATGHADVIHFTYASIATDGTPDLHSRIDIYEAATCVLSVGWQCTPRDPSAAGMIKLLGPISLLRGDGLYVSIWNVGNLEKSLDIGRALIPVPE